MIENELASFSPEFGIWVSADVSTSTCPNNLNPDGWVVDLIRSRHSSIEVFDFTTYE